MMLELDGLTHRYGDQPAVEDVSFGIESGELVALLGPSGCGKTTVVQAVAGHLRPTSGRVFLRGEDVTTDPPETRRVSVVFQRPTLYPHLSVVENVAFGLRARGVDPDRRVETATRYLDLVDLDEHRDARPAALSGGQQRRVELARALAPEPDVLLLDEPLSSLDRSLREQLRAEIARIQRETGVTTLFVTHDQDRAMALADRLVVMHDGRVAGVGQPRDLYESPPSPFVASFLGRSNALPASVVGTSPPTVELGGATVTAPGLADECTVGDRVRCYVRPRDLSLDPESADGSVRLSGTVRQVADVGRRYDVSVELPSGETVEVERSVEPPPVGDQVTLHFAPDDLLCYPDSGGRQQ